MKSKMPDLLPRDVIVGTWWIFALLVCYLSATAFMRLFCLQRIRIISSETTSLIPLTKRLTLAIYFDYSESFRRWSDS